MKRLCAYVGIGDGDSKGKHDRKHQSDDGLVDCCHHTIRCACCFLSPSPALVVQLLLLHCNTSYHVAAMYDYFLQHDCKSKVALLLMSPCSFCPCKHYALWLLKIAFVQSKRIKYATMGWPLR